MTGVARASFGTVSVHGSRSWLRSFLLFRARVYLGAQIFGELECSGVGAPVERAVARPVDEVWRGCAARNAELLKTFSPEKHEQALWDSATADARLHRMSEPQPIDRCALESVLLHPRFSVVQYRKDGSLKIRSVDNLSWSPGKRRRADSMNGYTVPGERMSHDTLDDLLLALRELKNRTGVLPGLMKADIDSAFRRLPIRAADRWAAGIAFRMKDQVSTRVCHRLRCCTWPCAGLLEPALHLYVLCGWQRARVGAYRRCAHAPGAVSPAFSVVPLRGRLFRA